MHNSDETGDFNGQGEKIDGPGGDEISINDNVNLLRKKTFNVELKKLVSRIKTNEESPDDEEEDLSEVTQEKLLQMFHQLFYKTKNLEELQGINHSFNPFAQENFGRDPETGLHDYIKDFLKKRSLILYSILVYDNNEKCFVQAVRDFEKHIILNPKDKLYQKIKKSEYGHILSKIEISKDLFLSKNFTHYLKEDRETSLYFIEFDRINSHFQKELGKTEKIRTAKALLPSILVLENLDAALDAHEIFNLLAENLSIPLYIIMENTGLNLDEENFDNFNELVSSVENFLILHQYFEGYCAIIISTSEKFSNKNLFKMKYIHTKFTNVLPKNSLIMRISNNKIIILTDKTGLSQVNTSMENFNAIDGNIYQVDVINETNTNNYEDNLKKICL